MASRQAEYQDPGPPDDKILCGLNFNPVSVSLNME